MNETAPQISVGDLARRHGAPVAIALGFVAAKIDQRRFLFRSFDTFGSGISYLPVDPRNETAIDLEADERILLEKAEGREPGTKIVKRDADAQRSRAACSARVRPALAVGVCHRPLASCRTLFMPTPELAASGLV